MKLKLFNLLINQITTERLLAELLEYAKINESAYLCAVNSHMIVEAQDDEILKEAILNADWAVTDGVPVSWVFSHLNNIKQERIAGMNITPLLIDFAEKNRLSISVYGNTKENLREFKKFITKTYPNLRIANLISPPFRNLTSEELREHIEQINNSRTNILFVSLGCPKQEKWMYENSSKLNGVCLGVGNAINTIIGQEKRPPKLVQTIGMEWLFRLIQNPKRLFKRYFYTNSRFCYMTFKEVLKYKKS